MHLLAPAEYLQLLVWPLVVIVGGLGLLALVCPKRFAQFSNRSSHWVDTNADFRNALIQ